MKSYEINASFSTPVIDIASNTSSIINAFSGASFINLTASPALVIFQNQSSQFLASPTQLSIRTNNVENTDSFEQLIDITKDFFRNLLPEGSIVAIRITSIDPFPDALQSSLNFCSLSLSSTKGIGYRFLIENANLSRYDEFKYEPLLADPNQLYFESTNLFKINMDADLHYFLQNSVEHFNRYQTEILQQIGN